MYSKKKYIGFEDSDSEIENIVSSEVKYEPIITEEIGDLFNNSKNSILIHSCNCMGSWNAGVAREFYRRYPQAFIEYQKKCYDRSFLGRCLLICPSRYNNLDCYIACLFTSYKYGTYKDKPDDIIKNTKSAINDLFAQLVSLNLQESKIKMPRINSGYFGVPWSQTKDAISSLSFDHKWKICVINKEK